MDQKETVTRTADEENKRDSKLLWMGAGIGIMFSIVVGMTYSSRIKTEPHLKDLDKDGKLELILRKSGGFGVQNDVYSLGENGKYVRSAPLDYVADSIELAKLYRK